MKIFWETDIQGSFPVYIFFYFLERKLKVTESLFDDSLLIGYGY